MSSSAPVATVRRRRGAVTRAERDRFLEALREAYPVTHAAALAGRERRRFYDLRDRDEAFHAEWADAWQAGSDLLLAELRDRALNGVPKPVFSRDGELVGEERLKDPKTLELALKWRWPEIFRESRLAIQGPTTVLLVESAFQRPAIEADVIEGQAVELEAGDGS